LLVKATGQIHQEVRNALIVIRRFDDPLQCAGRHPLTAAIVKLTPVVDTAHRDSLAVRGNARLDHRAALPVRQRLVPGLPPVPVAPGGRANPTAARIIDEIGTGTVLPFDNTST